MTAPTARPRVAGAALVVANGTMTCAPTEHSPVTAGAVNVKAWPVSRAAGVIRAFIHRPLPGT